MNPIDDAADFTLGESAPIQSALADLRSRSALIIAGLRLGGAAAFLLLAAVFGLVLGQADWRASLPLHAGYFLIAAALLAALRTPSLREHAGAAIPFADVLTVWVLQSQSLPRSPFPAGVAGWSLGPFVLLVLLASLTMRGRLIYLTALTASVCEGLLQREAGVGSGAIIASALVLFLAAGATAWAARRMELLVSRLVGEQVQARLQMARTAEVSRAHAAAAEAKAILEQEHAALVSAQREAEVLSSLLVHDMKGPLSTVLMRLEMAQREVAGKPALLRLAKDLKIAKVQGHRLLAMIEDLLAITRLEKGTLTPKKEPAALSPVLEAVATAYEGLSQSLGVSVAVVAAPEVQASFDRELIERVLENLVSNAHRFVESGDRVELSAALEAGGLVLRVRNSGAPLPEELRPILFNRFSTQGARGRGNAGLGLYFCRLVAEAHGGSISLEDAPDWNVTFAVRLPLT